MYNTKYFLLLKKVKRMSTLDFQQEFDLRREHACRIMKNLSKLNEIELIHEMINENGKTYIRAFVIYKG